LETLARRELKYGWMTAGPKLHSILALVLAAALVTLPGCLTAIRTGIREMRGAQADVLPVSSVPDRAFVRYQRLVFEPATSTVGPSLCPPALLRAYDRAADEVRRDLAGLFPGGEPALRVSSEILYFQKKGLSSAALCLTRLKFFSEGQLVADAIVLAESEAFREGDERALAKASLRAVHHFIRHKHGTATDED
jgi:hypothetical protein